MQSKTKLRNYSGETLYIVRNGRRVKLPSTENYHYRTHYEQKQVYLGDLLVDRVKRPDVPAHLLEANTVYFLAMGAGAPRATFFDGVDYHNLTIKTDGEGTIDRLIAQSDTVYRMMRGDARTAGAQLELAPMPEQKVTPEPVRPKLNGTEWRDGYRAGFKDGVKADLA